MTDKEQTFEELIKELRPFLRKVKRLDYGPMSLEGDYNGYEFNLSINDKSKKYKCKACSRVLMKKSAHKCNGKMAKFGIEWKEVD